MSGVSELQCLLWLIFYTLAKHSKPKPHLRSVPIVCTKTETHRQDRVQCKFQRTKI